MGLDGLSRGKKLFRPLAMASSLLAATPALSVKIPEDAPFPKVIELLDSAVQGPAHVRENFETGAFGIELPRGSIRWQSKEGTRDSVPLDDFEARELIRSVLEKSSSLKDGDVLKLHEIHNHPKDSGAYYARFGIVIPEGHQSKSVPPSGDLAYGDIGSVRFKSTRRTIESVIGEIQQLHGVAVKIELVKHVVDGGGVWTWVHVEDASASGVFLEITRALKIAGIPESEQTPEQKKEMETARISYRKAIKDLTDLRKWWIESSVNEPVASLVKDPKFNALIKAYESFGVRMSYEPKIGR